LGLWAEKGRERVRGIEPDGIACHRRSTITVGVDVAILTPNLENLSHSLDDSSDGRGAL
jgi:hypothetical protein